MNSVLDRLFAGTVGSSCGFPSQLAEVEEGTDASISFLSHASPRLAFAKRRPNAPSEFNTSTKRTSESTSRTSDQGNKSYLHVLAVSLDKYHRLVREAIRPIKEMDDQLSSRWNAMCGVLDAQFNVISLFSPPSEKYILCNPS